MNAEDIRLKIKDAKKTMSKKKYAELVGEIMTEMFTEDYESPMLTKLLEKNK